MAQLKRPMYSPRNIKGPTIGKDVQIAKFAVGRYEKGLLPKPPDGYTETFGSGLYEALHKVIQPREGIKPTGDIGQATWDVLWAHLDDYHRWQYLGWSPPLPPPKPKPVPALGPLYIGGASVLNHQLTHNTDGLPYYPAYDDGWIAGRTVLAVENMIVDTKHSSADPGAAFYATGNSTLRYWYGHLTSAPALGHVFAKGDPVGKIYDQGAKSHVHLGIDARPLIGHSLLYGRDGNGPDYTYGASAVGIQLKEALSLE